MDRGLGNYYRGNGGGNVRREDRRYDDFYADRERRGAASFRGNRSGGSHRGGGSRDRGFFGNQGNQNTGQNSVIAALQLQNQNLLSAYIRNQSRGNVFQHQQQQRKGYNQGSSFRPGDKRRQESSGASGFNKRPKQSASNDRSDRRSSSGNTKSVPKKEAPKKEEPKEILPEIPDDQVEIPDNLMDNVEKLRQRKDVERNVADEDIEKLLVFSFNGKGYDCLTCGFMLMKDIAFRNHLTSKSHVMKVIEARSDKKYQSTRDLLEIDLLPDGWFEKSETAKKVIIKQARLIMKIDIDKKKRELDSYNRDPKNFFSVNMSSMKSATMTGDTVRITSVVESTIDVKEFSNNRFFGCEFVKTVSSFQCRLCDIKIHNASEVLAHIDSRVHRNKYQMHLKRYPDYETKQKDQNKELGGILQEHEGQAVLLSETTTNKSTDDGQGKTVLQEVDPLLIRVPEILNPTPKEDPKAESKEDKSKESTAAEETTTSSATEKADEEKKEEETVKDEPMETEASTTNAAAPATTAEENANDTSSENKDEKEAESKEEKSAEEATSTSATVAESTEANQETAEDKKEQESTTAEKVVEEEKKLEEVPMISPQKAEPKPRKSILKKGTTKARGGSARRGTPRGKRGGKAATSASPKTPSTPAMTTDEATPTATEESTVADETKEGEEDGSFMDGFQIVDEVKDD